MLIRTRLLLLALSILIPASLAAIFSVYFVYTEQKESNARSMSEAARALALLVDNDLRTREAALISLAKSPTLRRGDFAAFEAHAKEVVQNPDKVVVLSSLAGQQLINTRAKPGQALPTVGAGILALREASPNKTVVSDLFIGAVAQRKDVAVDVPVVIDRELRYRLAIGFEAAALEELLSDRRSTDWLITILDRKGAILARSLDSENFLGKSATESLLRRVLAGEKSGENEGVTLDGIPVTAFFHRAPWSSWTVVISVPEAEIQQPARRAALLLAGPILALFGIGTIAARWNARKTAASVESLRLAAENLGEGKPDLAPLFPDTV